jgi:hypothetical protein
VVAITGKLAIVDLDDEGTPVLHSQHRKAIGWTSVHRAQPWSMSSGHNSHSSRSASPNVV